MPLASWLPTISPPIRPGPALAATPSRSANRSPARAIACSHQVRQRCARWARAAISGTTPPNGACSRSWLSTSFRQHAAVGAKHRGGGLVARRFDAQHRAHSRLFPSFPQADAVIEQFMTAATLPASTAPGVSPRALPLRVGTRGSPLALVQTRAFLQQLATFCPVLRRHGRVRGACHPHHRR